MSANFHGAECLLCGGTFIEDLVCRVVQQEPEAKVNVSRDVVQRRPVIAAAALFGAYGIGIDLDPERIAIAKTNARTLGVPIV